MCGKRAWSARYAVARTGGRGARDGGGCGQPRDAFFYKTLQHRGQRGGKKKTRRETMLIARAFIPFLLGGLSLVVDQQHTCVLSNRGAPEGEREDVCMQACPTAREEIPRIFHSQGRLGVEGRGGGALERRKDVAHVDRAAAGAPALAAALRVDRSKRRCKRGRRRVAKNYGFHHLFVCPGIFGLRSAQLKTEGAAANPETPGTYRE